MLLKDIAYNLFLYVEKSTVTALGMVPHELDGTDEEKISALHILVDHDHKTAQRLALKDRLEWREYESLMRLGRQLEIFEAILQRCKAPVNPLVVITPIVDEMPRILAIVGTDALNFEDLRGTPLERPGVMVDYLKGLCEGRTVRPSTPHQRRLFLRY
jgi:hypothetical protein